MQDSAGTRVHW